MSKWTVSFSSKAARQARRLAKREKTLLEALVKDLQVSGPVVPAWPNYSKLTGNAYHCHLNYRWVACWTVEDRELKLIELYYVGSREDAPY